MEFRNTHQEEMQRKGKMLTITVEKFLGLEPAHRTIDEANKLNQRLKDESDIDIHKIETTTKEDLVVYFNDRLLNALHIQLLSDYFRALSDQESTLNRSLALLQRAMELLYVADVISQSMSMVRLQKRQELERLLQQKVSEL